MSHNPEQAMVNAAARESAAWQPLIDGQKAAMAATDKASAVARTAQNYMDHYEEELAKMRRNHERELIVLNEKLRLSKKWAEEDITKNQMSSYNYKVLVDATRQAIKKAYGEDALDDINEKAIAIARSVHNCDLFDENLAYKTHDLML